MQRCNDNLGVNCKNWGKMNDISPFFKGSFFSKGSAFLIFHPLFLFIYRKDGWKTSPLFLEIMSSYLEFSHLQPNETVKVAFLWKSSQNGCFFRFFIHFSSWSLSRKSYLYLTHSTFDRSFAIEIREHILQIDEKRSPWKFARDHLRTGMS